MISARARYHLAYRLLIRFQQVADPAGGARSNRWRALALGCAAGDVLTGRLLARRSRFMLGRRLALDAADAAVWSLAPYPGDIWDWAVLPGVPLSMEAGMEIGAAGITVPAANYAAVRTARRRAGRATSLAPFVWQVLSLGAGLMFTWLDRSVRNEAVRDELRRRHAERNHASLAGQNSVAIGTANALDRLRKISLLLGDDRPDSPVRELCEAWRASLADRTRSEASYLRDTLVRYEQRRRQDPDLGSHLHFTISEDAGTLVLSAHQATALEDVLDGLPLRGATSVSVDASIRHRPPGAALPLDIGGLRVVLPEDPRRPPRQPDIAPVVLVLNAAWFGRTASSTAEAVPVRVVAGPIAASLAGAVWADRRLRERGTAARSEIMAFAIALSTVHTILASRTMRRPTSDFGAQNFPVYATTAAPVLIGSYYLDTLSTRARAALFGGLGLIAVAGALSAPRPVKWGQYIVNLSWSLGGLIPGMNLETAFRALVEPELAPLRAETEDAVAAAFDDGRRSVLDRVALAARDARALLDDRRADLSCEMISEVEQALTEVDRCLTAPGSSS